MSFIKSKLQTAINNNMKNTFKTLLFISLLCGVSGADEMKSVMEGDSVTLQTDENKILTYNNILWRFKGDLIAEIPDEGNIKNVTNVRFTGRLKLDNQTGSLTITNIRTNHSGEYKIEINTDTGTTKKKITLTVNESPSVIDPGTTEVKSVEVIEGESVSLNTDINPHGDELIVWRFGGNGALIAKEDKENNKISLSPDERFKDRIHLDQTGSLIITDSRTAHTGEYKLKISSNNREPIYKRFILIVNHPPMSAAAKAGITLAVLGAVLLVIAAAAAAGVIYYRKISELERLNDQWRRVSEMEGKSVPLITDDIHIKTDDVNLYHKDTLIAQIRRGKITPVTDVFRERLKLNHQTGSLTINNSKCSDSGVYILKIKNGTGEITYKRIIVTVRDEGISEMVTEGNPVNLFSGVTELQEDAEVEWKFKNTVIAHKKQKDKKISLRQDAHDGKFKQNLLVDKLTGSLTITDITMDQSGDYELKITSRRATIHKIFNVSVSGEGILKTVMKGDRVDLFSDVAELQEDAEVELKFKNTVIADKKQKDKMISLRQDAHDGKFRHNLQVEQKTGSLFITNIRPDQSGDYELKIISRRVTVHQRFNVSVIDELILKTVMKGDRVDLFSDVAELQEDAEVEWKFKTTVIADKKQKDKMISVHQDAHDGKFRGRLNVNQLTGSLIITDITMDQSGKYELKIISSRATVHKIINVSVSDEADVLMAVEALSKELENIEADDGVNESDGLMNNAAANGVNEYQVTSPV
ncbi:uncharacterized protein LOC127639742 [Xyrauchen texanus]|uniref:uncharacterized protein LOC127639742 n=1 Tax=Xyrauchen texanus TaxID=154827 RepID=UPI002241F0D9|nr:uncharacterized protein LOC127639742 [Xyrauchen texanus]